MCSSCARLLILSLHFFYSVEQPFKMVIDRRNTALFFFLLSRVPHFLSAHFASYSLALSLIAVFIVLFLAHCVHLFCLSSLLFNCRSCSPAIFIIYLSVSLPCFFCTLCLSYSAEYSEENVYMHQECIAARSLISMLCMSSSLACDPTEPAAGEGSALGAWQPRC